MTDLRTAGNKTATAIASVLSVAGRGLLVSIGVLLALLVVAGLVGGLIYLMLYFAL